MPATHRIPVTVLTGFLGSGKTTLLNRILAEHHGHRIAVIENEFGEIGIDHQLVIGADEEILELNNGCICCTVRGDLVRILGDLLTRRDRFDRILVETTGVADPGPVAQTFLADPAIAAAVVLDGVITVVDAHHVLQQLERDGDECRRQIAFADVLLLNKIDTVDAARIQRIQERVSCINPSAQLHPTARCDIDIAPILDLGGFDLDRVLEQTPGLLAHGQGPHPHDHDHDHDHHHHHHAEAIGSVGIDLPGEVDFPRFQDWFSRLISTRGGDVYRCKGILAIQGEGQRLVFHGVHMLVETRLDRPWGRDERRVQIVFIGRNLDRHELTHGVAACMTRPPSVGPVAAARVTHA